MLFGEHNTVPDEVDSLGHTTVIAGTRGATVVDSVIGGEVLFGDPPAERVVPVTPTLAVRCGHTGQPVVGVPGVPPGTRLRRQPLVLAQRHPTLTVVFVTDTASAAEQRAGVLPSALRGGVQPVAAVVPVVWRGQRPGRVGDVPRRVVGVALLPVGAVDCISRPASSQVKRTVSPAPLVRSTSWPAAS